MSGAANLAPSLLALSAAFCFAVGLILTQYGLRTVPSCRVGSTALAPPLVKLWGYFAAGRNLSVAEKGRNGRANSSNPPETPQG